VAVAARNSSSAQKWAVDHRRQLGAGVQVFDGYESLLRSPDVEAVYIPVPTGLHYEVATSALERGKHVLIEKPFAANGEEARRMAELAQRKGLVLMEGMHWYYHPLRERMRAVVASGIVGPVRTVDVRFQLTMSEAAKKTNSRYNRALAGGATLDLGVYVMSCLMALMGGEVPAIRSAAAKTWGVDPEIDEAVDGEVYFEQSSVSGRFSYSFLSGPAGVPDTTATVRGDNGTIEVSNFLLPHLRRGGSIAVSTLSGTTLMKEKVRASAGASTYALQLEAFIKNVRKVQNGAVPSFANTGTRVVALASLLDDIYRKAGMRPRVGAAGILPSAGAEHSHRQLAARCDTTSAATKIDVNAVLSIAPWTAQGRQAAAAAVLHHPCKDNLDSSLMYELQPIPLARQGAERMFPPALAAAFRGQGFVLVHNNEPSEVALLQKVLGHVESAKVLQEHPSQPNRRKFHYTISPLTSDDPTHGMDSEGFMAVRSLRGLQSIFFVAYHLLRPAPDYAAHHRLNPSTNYIPLVLEMASLSIMDNANDPGSVYQNAHWDYPNWDAGWLFIDVPLKDVQPGGGPLEVWPGTQHLMYNETFLFYNELLRNPGSFPRQYSKCFPELNAICRLWPSGFAYSSLGDFTVRYPSTWHRGTPNRGTSTRHMLTFLFKKKGQNRAYAEDGRLIKKLSRAWG